LPGKAPFRTRCGNRPQWCCFCSTTRWCPTSRPPHRDSGLRGQGNGGVAAGPRGTFAWKTRRAGAARRLFPPLDHALVQAVAWERVAETQQPLSRPSLADVTARARNALCNPRSGRTGGRILATAAIKPWRAKDGSLPRDPHCAEKAGPILALSAGRWHGQPLGPQDDLLSAAEKTSIPARRRCQPALPPAPGRPADIEHDYERGGALPYLAAGDVRRGYGMGRGEPTPGIAPCGRLVHQVLTEEPYRSGERRGWIVDNGSSPRGAAAKKRRRQVESRLMLVHPPVHASGLKQVDISFSLMPRKVLTPNDCADLEAIRRRLAWYEALSNQNPAPFQGQFARTKLPAWLAKLEARQRALADARFTRLQEAA
jgi:hypothetical protein